MKNVVRFSIFLAMFIFAIAGCDDKPEEKKVAVTGITVSPPAVSLAPGSTQQLTATVTPDDATNKAVAWSSGNTACATVSADGMVTIPAAAPEGMVTITATTADGGKTAKCAITVTTVIVQPTGITISPSGEVSVEEGKTTTLTATVAPANATNKNVTWSSLNPGIATVNAQTGVVTGEKAGTATISASVAGSVVTANKIVTVITSTVKVTGITIAPSGDMTVEMGRTVILTVAVTPDNASNKNAIWSSDNTGIAMVNEAGVVTGISAGTTTIRATTTDDSGMTATKSVSVIPSLPMTGSGTSADPYIIRTPPHLDQVRDNLAAHYKLGNNVDLSGYLAYGGIGYVKWNTDGWLPLGMVLYYTDNQFTGSFDGAGYKITGLWMSRYNYAGLFYRVSGMVKNLGVEIAAKGIAVLSYQNDGITYIGGIATSVYDGSITNCYVTGGAISGAKVSSGVAADIYDGSISNCYSICSVSGSMSAGGVVGNISGSSIITNSYSTGAISCRGGDAGGVVGVVYRGSITNCYSTGVVSSSASYGIGGISGGVVGNLYRNSSINNCYSTGAVNGVSRVGGVLGSVSDNGNSITNCYAIGIVSSTGDYVGGVVGYFGENGGTITNCVALSASVTSSKNTVHIGRVAGFVFQFESLANNWARNNMTVTANSVNKTLIKAGNMLDGADCDPTPAANWWTTAAPNGPGWSNSNWTFSTGQLPKFR